MNKKFRSVLLFTFFMFLFTFTTGYVIFSQKNNVNSAEKLQVLKTKEISDLKVDTISEREEILVYPSGQSCGVKILTDGVLVVAVTDLNGEPSPAKTAGLLPGDFLKKVNGLEIKNSRHFIKIASEANGKELNIEYERNKKILNTTVKPVLLNDEYIVGMWVRDSTAGLGTLTFFTGDKQKFAALGHSISDVDTGEVMPVKDGDLVKSHIVSINKGENGNPGALTGVFNEPDTMIGNILENSDFGLYGEVTNDDIIPDAKPVPIGYKKDIKLGKASILTTLEDNKCEEFEIEIIKINKQDNPDIKGMVIQVTDPELISKTGGIIQGMSGSPIIQNGKLIGAVTHV